MTGLVTAGPDGSIDLLDLNFLTDSERSVVARDWLEAVIVHFRAPVSRTSLTRQFAELTATWRQDSQFWSSPDDVADHPAYRQIVALGRPALPLILQNLSEEPDHWFLALAEITGADPVPADSRGNIQAMTRAWLAWGRAHGIIR
jgi:hypothetical protein